MFKQKGTVLGCFSPPVMVATFAVEIFLAAHTFIRFKMNPKGRAIIALLVCLAAFQLAEFYVCTQSSFGILASRAGYVAITFLPAIGLYLMSLLTVPMQRKTHYTVFGTTFLVAMYFLFAPNAFKSYECTGNYVIFQMSYLSAFMYGIFYYFLLAAAILRGVEYLVKSRDVSSRSAARWLLAGYAIFIVPVAVLTVLHPDTRQAVPSLLCGFAILLAIILGVRVAPLALKKRN